MPGSVGVHASIADFPAFCKVLHEVFEAARQDRGGKVATYIPELGRVDPELFGLGVCTIEGEQYALGDADVSFCVQSCCKPANYIIALEEVGETEVHKRIGREPSGRGFNELTFDTEGRPHNPMVNAGGILACSMIQSGQPVDQRLAYVQARWAELCGGRAPVLDEAVYRSERETADRNFALGHLMREGGLLPKGADLHKTLDLYFRCCSLQADVRMMAVLAATLANGGQCPLTGERVIEPSSVRACLSLMSSCGMYDFSGEFAFTVGIPAKSGVSGCLMAVVPNVMGFCVWSPRLESHGNSARGLAVCRHLVSRFNFHTFDNQLGRSGKQDPRALLPGA